MTGTEKKTKFIINTVYVAIIVALFYLFFKYALGTVFPIICAAVVAMILQKPVDFVNKKTHINRGFVSAVFVLLSFFFIVAVLGLIIVWVGTELKGFFRYFMVQLEDIPALVE